MKTMTYDQIKAQYETYIRLRETPDVEYVRESEIHERSERDERED